MASDVDALLAELLTSDDEEYQQSDSAALYHDTKLSAATTATDNSITQHQPVGLLAPHPAAHAVCENALTRISEAHINSFEQSDVLTSTEPNCTGGVVEDISRLEPPRTSQSKHGDTTADGCLSEVTTQASEISELQQEQQLSSGWQEARELVLEQGDVVRERSDIVEHLEHDASQEPAQQQQQNEGEGEGSDVSPLHKLGSHQHVNSGSGGLERQREASDAAQVPLDPLPLGSRLLEATSELAPNTDRYASSQESYAGDEVEQIGQLAQRAKQSQDFELAHDVQHGEEPLHSMMDIAVALERRLATDSEELSAEPSAERAAYHQDMLLASLMSQLEVKVAGQQTPHEEGFVDDRGGAVGVLAAARAFLSPAFEPLFRGQQQHGMPSVLTKYRSMVAVGTSGGSVYALMPAGKKDPHGQPRLVEVGASERSSGPGTAGAGDGVTSLCMAQHGSSSIVMVSGHASGALKFWELKSHITGGMAWSLSKTLTAVHASAVTSCALLEGGPTTWALSGDAHGRLMCHNVSRHLSVAAQALTSFTRQLTGGGGIPSHLISLQAAGQDPGIVAGISPLHAVVPQQATPAGRAGAAGEGAPANAEQAAFVYVPDVGHFVMLCAARAVLLCLLSQEGRIRVLHVFLPPPNTPADHPPYAAWRLEQDQQGAAFGAVVAVAWQHSVSVYQTVLLWRRPASQGRRQSQGYQQEAADQPPLPPPALLNSWVLRHLVAGTFFLASGTLLVAASRGETATEVLLYLPEQYSSATQKLSQQGGGRQGGGRSESGSSEGEGAAQRSVERLVVRDWVVGSQVSPLGGGGVHSGMACFGEQTLLLMSQGVRVVQLLGWQQRLSALVAQRRFIPALLAAVRVFHAAGQPSGAVRWPAEGAGANPPDVSRQILLILCGMLDTELPRLAAAEGGSPSAAQALHPPHTASPSPVPVQPPADGAAGQAAARPANHPTHVAWLAEVCINTCLFLGRPDALLGEVFPRWSPTPLLPCFLKQLEPHILRDQLPSLAPEVMQALVELFVREGQPERVERCVLRMDIMSLDLNQLIPLCLRHHLYGALLHIFTGAMQDYQTPASLLLVAAAAELDREAAAELAPAVHHPASPEGAALLERRAGLRLGYKLLVFLRCCLRGEGYPPGCGPLGAAEQQHAVKLQAVAFLLHASCLSVWECWKLWGEMAHAEEAESLKELPLSIAEPHPALRLLCRMDASATLRLLRGALAGWDALEADVAEAVPGVAQQLSASAAAGDRTVTQAVVDAVVSLLQTNSLKGASAAGGHVAMSAAAGGAGEAPALRTTSAETTALQFVADHLASNRAVVPPSIVMRILGHLAAPRADMHGQHERLGQEREGTFRDVVTHAAKALGEMDRQEALWLARRAGFHQAEARMRELEGAHGEALACLTKDSRHPQAPFRFVRDLLTDPATREALEQAVLQQAALLLQLDATSAAQLVLDCFPHQQQEVLRRLAPTPRLQLHFLQQLVGLQHRGRAEPGADEMIDDSLKAGSRDPHLRPLLGDTAVANLFVELLCRFDPGAVLPFLQSHDTYGVDDCLRKCMEHAVQDGAAYLLERRGDVQTAVGIYIQSLESANQALVCAVKAGGDVVDSWAEALLPAGHVPQKKGPRRPSLSWGGWQGHVGVGAPGAVSPAGGRQGPRGGALPELQAAQEALRNAVAVCVRFSQDRLGLQREAVYLSGMSHPPGDVGQGEEGEMWGAGQEHAPPADPVQQMWFRVLQGYVIMIRELRQEEQRLVAEREAPGGTAQAIGGTGGADVAGQAGSCHLDPARHQQLQRVMLLQDMFTGFMEEVIGGMSGHVPMRAIAESVMRQYSQDQWGDFKSTLLGLLNACNFELSILRCAHRVVGSDGARLLRTGYQQCSRPELGG